MIDPPDTPAGRALRALVTALDGGPVEELVPLLASHVRAMVDNGTVDQLGAKLRPVRVERLGQRFPQRLDALLATNDGLRLCMIGTEAVAPHAVAFLQIRSIGGTPWEPSNGNRFVDHMRNELELVGLAVAVVDGDDTAFDAAGDVDERTVFRIGSVTKPMTAIGVHQCIADGLFALDDPLDALLPDVDVPAEATVAQVVGHTSGLESSAPIEVAEGDTVPSIPELLEAAPLRLAFEPGTQHSYCNIGYGLLGHLIGTARGAPFENVMRERLFAPLGMTDTGYVLAHSDSSRLAEGRQSIVGLVSGVPWTEVAVLGAGSVFSTAADLARLARAVFDSSVPVVGWVELGHRLAHNGAWNGFSASVLLEPWRRRAAVLLTNTDNVTTTGLFETYAPRLLDEVCGVD